MLNLVVETGRIASDLVLQSTGSGVPFVRFRLAVDRDYAVNEDRPTDFLSFIAWRKTAEFICKHFSKGAMVSIQGSLEENKWTDEKGGKHYGMVVTVGQVWFGETKKAREDRQNRAYGDYQGEAYAYTDEDVPPEFLRGGN